MEQIQTFKNKEFGEIRTVVSKYYFKYCLIIVKS